jgi:hypothetical protein
MNRLLAVSLICVTTGALAQQSDLSFFVTSVGSGKGADLGGLQGADRHCQALAQAAGAGNKTWRAYLSTQGDQAVNARDRIGAGPWHNAKGVVIPANVDELHSQHKLNKETALTEKGARVNGRGDTPNMHDILTGSQPDGRAFPAGEDRTCGNWTKSGEGAASLARLQPGGAEKLRRQRLLPLLRREVRLESQREKSVQRPTAMKPMPPTIFRTRGDIRRSSWLPTSTPMPAASTSAVDDAAKTIHLFALVSAEKSIVASCVLSPISARNTVTNTVTKVCQNMSFSC